LAVISVTLDLNMQ